MPPCGLRWLGTCARLPGHHAAWPTAHPPHKQQLHAWCVGVSVSWGVCHLSFVPCSWATVAPAGAAGAAAGGVQAAAGGGAVGARLHQGPADHNRGVREQQQQQRDWGVQQRGHGGVCRAASGGRRDKGHACARAPPPSWGSPQPPLQAIPPRKSSVLPAGVHGTRVQLGCAAAASGSSLMSVRAAGGGPHEGRYFEC